ncbi:MAG: helix-turn-helix domain-containing protein [Planctomycetes bacterium]|nr:helix-turn-helix domain-containing protein [Planctomycetota bacterium]MCB9901021.1 helix-turn-helix domain-containing protein [Planctomycetota bacterium]
MPRSAPKEPPAPQPARPLLPLPQAATYLSIGLRTLKGLIAAGELPIVRVSPRRVAIDPRDLDAYVASRRR